MTYALIEIGDAKGTAAELKRDGRDLTRLAALIALDQMDGGGLKPEVVAAELTSGEARTRETAWWIAGRHPEWAPVVIGFLRERLGAAEKLTPADQNELVRHLAKFAGSKEIQRLLAERLIDSSAGGSVRRIILRVMARSNLKEAPEDWLDALTSVLNGNDAELQTEAVAAIRALRISPKQASRSRTTGSPQLCGRSAARTKGWRNCGSAPSPPCRAD